MTAFVNPALIGRNRPCPCGSGKKRKYCHPDDESLPADTVAAAPTSTWRYVLIAAIAMSGLAVASYQLGKPTPPPVVQPHASETPSLGATAPMAPALPLNGNAPLTPPPPGPVPAGKVWSPEHGHWHDASTGAATTITTNPTPPAPTISGVPGTLTQIPSPLRTSGPGTPQPPGEVPPGKVWDTAHGHWHDLPAGNPPAPTPAPH